MRYAFAPLRVLLLLLHVLDGLLITGLAFPALAQPKRNRIIRAWSRGLLRICGMRLVVTGCALDPRLARDGVLAGARGRLVLANHVSWIDVFALLATLPSRFVAKAEIGRWPLLGLLVTLVGTLYLERGRRHAVAAMNQRVRDRLKDGHSVVVFAEGTTTDGFSLLPFHSNLIAPALEVGCEIWPVAVRYTDRGVQTSAACFVGEMGLLTSLWNILVAGDIEVEIALLPSLVATADSTRHQLAHLARVAIANHLGVALDPPPHAARPANAPAASPTAPPLADTSPARGSAPASASQ
jgi:1-acyl-sn-glycerol-3-phosphate acyltransferase